MSSLVFGDCLKDLRTHFLDGGMLGDCKGKVLWPGGQTSRVIFDRELDLTDPLRNGKTQHIEWVECNTDFVALGALNTRFELAIKQVHEDALLSFLESFPELLRDFLVRAIV